MNRPKLIQVLSTIDYSSISSMREYAECPQCGKQSVAVYQKVGNTDRLIVTDTCHHFSDLVNAGGTKVAFAFWVSGDSQPTGNEHD